MNVENESVHTIGQDLSATVAKLRGQFGEVRVRKQLEALEAHGPAVVADPELWLQTALARDFKFMPMERVRQCPCGSSESGFLSRFVYCNLLEMRQCKACNLIYVSPRLSEETIRLLFNKSYFDESSPEYWGHRRLPVFKDVLRLLRRFHCRNVFDVGAAFGQLLSWLERRGIAASGCDISEPAVEWGREHLKVHLYLGSVTDVDLPPASFDCIASLDTLYYASDPLAELLAMKRFIRPGGYLILRLRNHRGLRDRALREGRQPVGNPVLPMPHLWAFTPHTVTPMLRRCGFTLVLCEPAAYSRTPLSPLHAAAMLANRLGAKLPLRIPIMTRSFNVVARLGDGLNDPG